jgi:hypothetical protein
LGFFARRVFHNTGDFRASLLEASDKSFDAAIAVAKAIDFSKVLPDALRRKSLVQGFIDILPIRLTATGRAGGHPGRFCHRAGGHFVSLLYDYVSS